MLKTYLKKIHKIASRGDAREESYYSALEELLNGYAEKKSKKNVQITTLPKKTEAGNPDFRVWDGKQHIVGYIEAKAPTVQHLDQIETTEQLKRYLGTFPNVILTNFFEFRLYRNGNLIDTVQIARPFIVHRLKTIPPVENEDGFRNLLDKFFSFSLPKVYDAQKLAVELAKRTRFLRDEVVTQELKEEERHTKGILGFYEAFTKYLIGGLAKEEFADLYSQTITYGLFAARTRSGNDFNRKLAYDLIPRTIGILRDVFRFISLEDPPEQMKWVIDDISEVLAVTDVNEILHKYFHEGKGKDPIVHFYETFLAAYDPKTRKGRGVYYTPEPVVSYIVRSLHNILKEHFKRADGLASDTVTVLDPAAGTLTFLAEAAKCAVEEFVRKYGKGGKDKFIKEHVLKNFYAFELMMAPYAVGHLKMAFLLEELGYKLKDDDRFKLYLTNTLEMEELAQTELPGMASLSEESHLAGKIKKETPILVILGNPPYSGISANMNPWIDRLLKKDAKGLQSYYKVDGKPLGEKKVWLQDDYVKFIRFAQWKIQQAGEGVLGFITNHGYLDNPTFRGMRQSLMRSFNEIHILDLHGSSLKKEKCRDDSKDENVFDIQPGVAIALFVKKKGEKKECKVSHSEIWGLREKKYDWLLKSNVKKTKLQELKPNNPFYFFVPRDEKGRNTYEQYWKMTDIFPVNVSGIVTARDKFVIDFDRNSLRSRIMTFRNKDLSNEFVKQRLNLRENYMWRVSKARKELMAVENWTDYFTRILYRPFDEREIFLHPSVVWRTRKEVMRHVMQGNMGLLFTRPQSPKYEFSVLGSDKIIDQCVVGNKSAGAGNSYIAPLYLYPDPEKNGELFSNGALRHVNLSEEFISDMEARLKMRFIADGRGDLKKTFGPEDVFSYIYAVLYSPTYRERYAEFLRIDFPRVPITSNVKLFGKMAEYGKSLVDLHLLKSAELDTPIARFQGEGGNRVEKLRYDEKKKHLHINESQYFEGIAKEVWEYQVGGYQVASKWLKDRKKRILSLDDIKHYCKVITALQKTMEIQKTIDALYPEVEKQTIATI